jgi:hypothetical protein
MTISSTVQAQVWGLLDGWPILQGIWALRGLQVTDLS